MCRIFGTYRDALVFRCSHYFVSFMSSATLLVSGIGVEGKQSSSSDILGFEVTKPLDVELPRSLIPVVVSWNIPIHLWVKTCELWKYFFDAFSRVRYRFPCLAGFCQSEDRIGRPSSATMLVLHKNQHKIARIVLFTRCKIYLYFYFVSLRIQTFFAMWNVMANSMQFFSRISSHRHCTASTSNWLPSCYRSESSPLSSFICEIRWLRYWMLASRRANVMSPPLSILLSMERREATIQAAETLQEEQQPLAHRKVIKTPRPWHGLRWSISYLDCLPSCCFHIWVCCSIYHPTSSNNSEARAFRGNTTWRNGSSWSFSVISLSLFGLLFI